MNTTILPHQTAEGPQDRAAWQQLLATAPRGTDSVGRATIQVCTASDGRGIFATVDYATWQTEKEEGRGDGVDGSFRSLPSTASSLEHDAA